MIRLYYTKNEKWNFANHDYTLYDTDTQQCVGIPLELLCTYPSLSYSWFTPNDSIPYVEADTIADIIINYPELLI